MSSRFALSLPGSTDSETALPVRTRLDSYEVEALIAQGHFALVYRAVHPATQHVVAIKEYFPGTIALRHATHRVTPRSSTGSERFEAGRRAFLDEARSLARFEHPSLVRVLGLFEANGTAYRVMRFTPGPTLLAHRLALGRMPAVEDFRRWVDGLLGALATLHHAGCVHGAVSPANILLRPGERPLLLGFDAVQNALAPARGRGAVQAIEKARMLLEGRAQSARVASTAADDLRALAATLRYCFEGGAPAAESLADAWRREGGPMPMPQDIVRLLRVIDACLSDEARERPQSVAEFRRGLDAAVAAEPIRVVAAASARDEVRPDTAAEANVGSPSAGDSLQDRQADPSHGEHAGTGRDPSSDAAPLPQETTPSAQEAEAEPKAAATVEVAGQDRSEVPAEGTAAVEAEVALEAAFVSASQVAADGPSEVGAELTAEVAAQVAAEVEAKAEVDGMPRVSADLPAPASGLEDALCTPLTPDSNPATSATDALATPPLGEGPNPGVLELISTTDHAAASPTAWPRRMAVGVAVAASVVLAIGATVWSDHQLESLPPAQPAPPAQAHDVAALRTDAVDHAPAPAVVPTPIPASMATHEANSRPAVLMPAPANAASTLAPSKQPRSAPVTPAPAPARKVVVAGAKSKSPQEACEGRKGFALYQCMQLQCAKAALSDHADCVSLR